MPVKHKTDLAIINRSFWPVYPVIGEALLRFAESSSINNSICVIMQDHVDIKSKLLAEKRGKGVTFYPCKAWTNSSSGILRRVFDAVFFMLWVFWALLKSRPKRVYVSTDPPVLVPFIVMIYAKLFGAKYVYHLQDIHPEAAKVVISINPVVFKLLRWLDSLTMRHAEMLITITEQMRSEIINRSCTTTPIQVLDNPAVSFEGIIEPEFKKAGFSFCGNAGRLQRMPLILASIDKYMELGGELEFSFAGGGVYAEDLSNLSRRHKNVHYLGVITPKEAAELSAQYEWGLLPIEDEVTKYAFPSKSSSYVFSGANILAICGPNTSVAAWVIEHDLGLVVGPEVNSVVDSFFAIENTKRDTKVFDCNRNDLKKRLNFDYFVSKLHDLILAED